MSTGATVVLGDIVTPNGVVVNGALVIDQGTIVNILNLEELNNDQLISAGDVLDYTGKYILPGGIDAHVHSFSDPREGFVAATKSAAAGGVTTIIDMPYDDGKPVNNLPRVLEKIAEIPGNAFVDVALHGTVKPGNRGEVIPELVDAGICGFKVSMFETDPNRFPRISNDELYEILQTARDSGVTVGVHAEDGEIIASLIDQFTEQGLLDPIYHAKSRPPISELTSVAAGVEIALAAGAPFHIFHASLPESIDLISEANAKGANISVETCPHYLVFSEEDMEEYGSRLKINPPVRSAQQVEELWEKLANGQIDMFTSDHAPWRLDKKSDSTNIFKNASGAPGVQLLYPLLLSEGFGKGRISLGRVTELMASGPANRFNLGHRKGQLAVGFDADFVVFDPTLHWRATAENQHSLAGWTPYEGREMLGKIEATYLRGTLVASAEEIVTPEGIGEFVRGERGSIV